MKLSRAFVLASGLALAGSVLPSPVSAQREVAPRQSLGTGTLRVGDRIVLSVDEEPTLTDTFTVKTGPMIDLPNIGAVQLAGITRDGIQAHLTTEIGKFIKNPVVRAQTLVRVAVLGEVARPGYFALPADALLSDAINEAGGPTGESEMKKIVLKRRGKTVQEGTKLRNNIAAGRTLDELGLEAGDELIIPRRPDRERTLRIVALLATIPVALLAFR